MAAPLTRRDALPYRTRGMRVLVVSQHYWPEPLRVADVASGLRGRGHVVEVLTGLPNYPTGVFYKGYRATGPLRELHEGIPITRVPVIPRGAGGGLRLALNYGSFAIAAALRAISLGRRQWDAIIVFQTSPVTSIFPAAIIRWLYGTPVATWVQDLWPESLKSTGFGRSRALYAVAKLISEWLYRRSDKVLGTSRSFQPRLESRGVPAQRFEYLPQWAEGAFATPCGEVALPPGTWSSGFPIMFAGNIGRVQSLETILEAAELVRDDDEIRWVFVGDGSRREWLAEQVARRGLQEKVFLLGRHPAHEMPAFFAKAGAMLVSLQRDDTMALTVPAKIQAYLAAARPIIASMDGEGARIIEESGAGFTAPAGDGIALANAVRRMKSLPEAERIAMGARGRDYSDRHFARERCLDEIERVLDDMVTGAKSPAALVLR